MILTEIEASVIGVPEEKWGGFVFSAILNEVARDQLRIKRGLPTSL